MAQTTPLEVQNLRIDVKVTVNNETGTQDNVQTTFFCNIRDCGHSVEMYADSQDTAHSVICPVHGKIGSFPTYAVYLESVRIAANRILAANGHDLISEKTKFFSIDDKADPKSSN